VRLVNVLVVSKLDAGQRSAMSALLARAEEADGHPALAEPQQAAAARLDLGAHQAKLVLAYEGQTLVGAAFITPAIDGAMALHTVVEPDHRRADQPETVRTTLIREALLHSHGRLRLWFMQADDADDAEAARLGFRPERDLLQMRAPLPLAPEKLAGARPVHTRPFRPGLDDEAWLSINNLAFAGHPEQGGWTHEDLKARLEADWFDPEGFLVAENEDGDGLIGSCWTKVHRDHEPVLGEIYVISVNPSRHGEGWGRALTVAGLQWMAGQGVHVGMLYTTSSNTAAVALYASLGFTIDHVDRSYLADMGSAGSTSGSTSSTSSIS
jgi:mycothiol synthase